MNERQIKALVGLGGIALLGYGLYLWVGTKVFAGRPFGIPRAHVQCMPSSQEEPLRAGTLFEYAYSIENVGEYVDAFDIEFYFKSPRGSDSFDLRYTELIEPGDSLVIDMANFNGIRVPTPALPNAAQKFTLVMRAKSQANPNAVSVAECDFWAYRLM